ncbi:hypothetical protein QU487_09800 [Crenobacter sp. SG2305]|uniref:hypothetical protein n=1 Tax=Crenobacter oryzisoli TaxID=3056844 RepID=UPI0025AB3E36|nr:hypothetical protein [Crenobacter sp. SG2305]MDN0083045.1 hypothetical protein [Crenobacter sp. SG2305]
MKKHVVALLVAGVFGAVPLVQAATSEAPQASAAAGEDVAVGGGVRIEATVKSVDLKKRMVTLTEADGSTHVLTVGKAARNLPQVKPGDKVVLNAIAAVAVSLERTKKLSPLIVEKVTTVRAVEGEKPLGAVRHQVTASVKVLDVDHEKNLVTIQDAKQNVEMLRVRSPAMQERLKAINAGDFLKVKFIRAVVIDVAPAAAN